MAYDDSWAAPDGSTWGTADGQWNQFWMDASASLALGASGTNAGSTLNLVADALVSLAAVGDTLLQALGLGSAPVAVDAAGANYAQIFDSGTAGARLAAEGVPTTLPWDKQGVLQSVYTEQAALSGDPWVPQTPITGSWN